MLIQEQIGPPASKQKEKYKQPTAMNKNLDTQGLPMLDCKFRAFSV